MGARRKRRIQKQQRSRVNASLGGGRRAPPVSLLRSVRSGIFNLAPYCEILTKAKGFRKFVTHAAVWMPRSQPAGFKSQRVVDLLSYWLNCSPVTDSRAL